MRQCITKKRGSALLMSALAMALLPGCAAEPGAPVVTEDDLTPSSTVQEVLKEDFTYFWLGEAMEQDPERLEQLVLHTMQEDQQQLRDLIQSEETSEEDKAILMEALDGTDQDAVLQDYQKWAQEQLEYDPVVSPQEAANRAGLLFEQIYGIDLTGTEIYIDCIQHEANGDDITFGGRMVWEATALDGPLASVRVSDQARACCTLDATTGEFITAYYVFSDEELTAMQNTPVHEAYLPGTYQWDTQHPGYPEAVNAVQQQLTQAFSGCMLADGAAVTDAKPVQSQDTALAYQLCCDNGKSYKFVRRANVDPYTQYDFGGYPLRACYIYNEAYYQ